ncbi:YraN family protein [Telmatocola sphagniphila]|uniref:UPF0102 protein KIH39_02690 n=1 Tax=Telmatocola sphagniphila TaxID=1123043 RepID=A0A8E6EVK2_9BACT|nr:YraN family protein [Telmatocola sphagniphila]QVL32845.1 YraN family protein [Telmatocola sphagniphila]
MSLPEPKKELSFTRHPWWRRWFGRRSEKAAYRFLRRQHFKIIGQNLEDHAGEIDLLAVDQRILVIVEVRSSEFATHMELAASVNAEKQRRLTQAALRFLQRRQLKNIPVRFDVLTIRWPSSARYPEIKHFRNAFPAVGKFQMHS